MSIPSTGMLGRRNPLPSIHLSPSHDSHMAWAWVQHEKVKPRVKVDPRLEADWRMAQGRLQRLRRSSETRTNVPAGRSLLGLCSRVRVFTKKGDEKIFLLPWEEVGFIWGLKRMVIEALALNTSEGRTL